MTNIIVIYDDSNDVDVDVLMYVANDNGYYGENINVNDHDSCDSNSRTWFIIVAPQWS